MVSVAERPTYEKAVQYVITSKNTDKVYIGFTCNENYLGGILPRYERHYLKWLNGQASFNRAYLILQYGDCKFTIIKKCENFNKRQLCGEKRNIITTTDNCVNNYELT